MRAIRFLESLLQRLHFVKEVPSTHNFHNETYVREWAETILQGRPERKQLIEAFVSEANQLKKKNMSVLELGSGPGFLAEELLARCSIGRYYLFDISPHMLKLSRSRLQKFSAQFVFVEDDFKSKNWFVSLPGSFDMVVALQSVHELRHASRIPTLYAQVYKLLSAGGVFLMCDQVNPASPTKNHEAHLMTIREHLATLERAGFASVGEILSVRDMSMVRGKVP